MKVRKISKNIIRCKICGDIIESKSRHDFVTCSCGACAVDGGLDYLRRCGDIDNWDDLSEYKEIEITPKYKRGDKVAFRHISNLEIVTGVIQVVDTYPGSTVVEYDVLDEKEPRLYKHMDEEYIIGKVE